MNPQARIQSSSPHVPRRRPGVQASKVVMNAAAVLIAALMLFLASEAASFITGSIMIADGGATVGGQ